MTASLLSGSSSSSVSTRRREQSMLDGRAAQMAAARVQAVEASTESRYRLAADFYERGHAATERGSYGLAELNFLHWEIERGVLDVPTGDGGGSPWWRAVNDELLRDKVEADLVAGSSTAAASSANVELWLQFIHAPSPAAWYRAHNSSIVAGYLAHESLAAHELPAERFMMNVALLRVIYAHALTTAPRIALGRLAPLGALMSDPRGRFVSHFLCLRGVFPDRYPLDTWRPEDLVAAERPLARALDYGLIAPRLTELYNFAAAALGEPRLTAMVNNGTPSYAGPTEEPWISGIRPLARFMPLGAGRRYTVR